jgi:3-isopropylmalate dehydrogenase
MFGDIVTDLASVLQGGMGMAAGCNVGDRHGMFEPIHGSAPKHAGKNRTNPMAMILATAEGLRWLGARKQDSRLVAAGDAIEASVAATIADGEPLTYDLVGEERAAPTTEVGAAIRAKLRNRLAHKT